MTDFDNCSMVVRGKRVRLGGPMLTGLHLCQQVDGSHFDQKWNSEIVKPHETCTSEHSMHEVLTLGVPRDAVDFLQRAVQAGHPRSISIRLSDAVKDVLRQNFPGMTTCLRESGQTSCGSGASERKS